MHVAGSPCNGFGEVSLTTFSTPAYSSPAPTSWQHTPWGRILIGLLLAQGLFYGLRHLFTGLVLAFHPAGATSEESALWGIVLLQLLQAAALVTGGVLAGSGQRSGALLGAVVGVWNGVLSGLTPQATGQPFSLVGLYGDPLVQTGLGALAGWLGASIWRPVAIEEPAEPRPVTRKAPPRQPPSLFAGKVAPIRVTLGTALAVIGSLSATALFQFIDRLNDDGQRGNEILLDQVVTWEIKALALIAGGIVAAANTRNGLKQGLYAGMMAAFVLAAVQPRGSSNWVEMAIVLVATSVGFCVIGGWFGCQLFPPLAPSRSRSGAERLV